MCSEHGVEPQVLELLGGFLRSEFLDELRVGLGQRAALVWEVRLEVAGPQGAHTVVLFREVHQVEVAGESAGHLICSFQGEGLNYLDGAVERLGRGVCVRGDRRGAKALNVLE